MFQWKISYGTPSLVEKLFSKPHLSVQFLFCSLWIYGPRHKVIVVNKVHFYSLYWDIYDGTCYLLASCSHQVRYFYTVLILILVGNQRCFVLFVKSTEGLYDTHTCREESAGDDKHIILKSHADTRIIDHLDCSLHPVYNDNNAVF